MTARLLIAYLFIASFFIPVEFSFFIGSIRLEPFRLILILATMVVFLRIDTIISDYNAADIWILVLVIVVMISHILNNDLSDVVEPTGIFFLEAAGSYFLAKSAIKNSDNFRNIYLFFIVLLILAVPLSLYEFVTGDRIIHHLSTTITGNFELDPDLETANYKRMGFTRATSFFTHPILYGSFGMVLLPLAYYIFKHKFNRKGIILTLLTGLNTVLSVSSGPMLGILVQTLITWYMILELKIKEGFKNFLFYILLSGLTFIHFYSNQGLIRLFIHRFTFNPATAFYRIEQWDAASYDINNHPFFGISLNDWTRPVWMVSDSIDSFWLIITLRYGYTGLLIVFIITGILMVKSYRLLDFNNHSLSNDLCKAWFISFITLLIVALTVDFFGKMHPFLFFFMGSISWAIIQDKREKSG